MMAAEFSRAFAKPISNHGILADEPHRCFLQITPRVRFLTKFLKSCRPSYDPIAEIPLRV
jgi:hypothetical protein